MDLNFSLPRTLVFVGCLVALWYLGGYRYPLQPEALVNGRTAGQSWMLAHLLYLVGAGSFALIDQRVGPEKEINLRLVYLVAGIGMMTASVIWLGRLADVTQVL